MFRTEKTVSSLNLSIFEIEATENKACNRTKNHKKHGSSRLSALVHGEAFSNWKSYGAVRCGYNYCRILRCSSMKRTSYGAVPSGGIFKNIECYVAIRCIHVASHVPVRPRCRSMPCSEIRNRNVRFGAVINPRMRCGAVRCGFCWAVWGRYGGNPRQETVC